MSGTNSTASPTSAGPETARQRSANRFFVWPAGAPSADEFDPSKGLPGGEATDTRYFAGLACELDRLLALQGITFLVTWHADAFEQRFRDAVVLLVGDEMYRVPTYAGEVRAIFKTGGTHRNPLAHTLALHPSIVWRLLLRDARNFAVDARRRKRAHRRETAPMFELPIGYFKLADVPEIPFAEREVDVFFAGSVESAGAFTVRPRLASRRQMTSALSAAHARLPGLRIDCTSSGPFANPNGMLDPLSYSRRLMRARIALCPRGNIDETFRLVEAARCGCVAISEPLPRRWYNRGAPVVELERWSSLPAALEALLADADGIEQRSEQMRNWWRESLSEHAAARFVASNLGALP